MAQYSLRLYIMNCKFIPASRNSRRWELLDDHQFLSQFCIQYTMEKGEMN